MRTSRPRECGLLTQHHTTEPWLNARVTWPTSQTMGFVLDMERGGSGKVMTEDESSPSLGRRASGGMHRAVLEEEGGPGHQ